MKSVVGSLLVGVNKEVIPLLEGLGMKRSTITDDLELGEVNLEGRDVDDNVIKDIVTLSVGLTSINLSYCRNITDSGLGEVARNCHGLTSINLSDCE